MTDLTTNFILTFLFAFFSSIVFTWIVRKFAIHFNILDHPHIARKIHTHAVPLLGGLAIFLAITVTLYSAAKLGFLADTSIPLSLLYGIGLGGLVLVIGGFIDDMYRLKWKLQIIFPIVAAIVVVASGVEISYVSNPLGEGLWYLDSIRWSLWQSGDHMRYFVPIADSFAFLWIMGMVYTTKLLDGVDGLTTSVSSIAAIMLFVVSLYWDQTGSTTSFLALALGGAGFGFLIWNWHPARIFLGEGGSTLLGFLLAILSIISGGKIATALLIMGIPILDVVWSIMRRFARGQKIFHGDNMHLHFRLIRAGLSQPQVTTILAVLSMSFGAMSFFVSTRGKVIGLFFVIAIMFLINYLLRNTLRNQDEDEKKSN